MSRIAYVNGRYVPHAQAKVAIEDRGYQFADGVYEVVEVRGGALIDEVPHLERLDRSLSETQIRAPLSMAALRLVIRETVRRNRVRDGMIYLQITRGVARRDHYFPDPPVRPSLVITACAQDPLLGAAKAEIGIKVVTLPDIRWKRPDIKSISLLPNVLAKQTARLLGAVEAWLVGADGLITEGAASNAWIIDKARKVVTRPADNSILRGITRTTLRQVIAEHGLELEERPFSVDEAYAAQEAFVTGATTLVMPVVAIDDRAIGEGRPGPIVTNLRRAYVETSRFHRAAGEA